MKHSIMLCVEIDGTFVPVTSPFDCTDLVYNSLVKDSPFKIVELPKPYVK